jgi:hypothetical protein
MSRRAYIPYPERLAAALACQLPQAERDDLRQRKVPATEVIGLFEFDHIALHAFETPDRDEWHNLDPKLVALHREKSRHDTSIAAKVKRLRMRYRPIDAVIEELEPVLRNGRPKRKIRSRGFQKGHRPMRRRPSP